MTPEALELRTRLVLILALLAFIVWGVAAGRLNLL
jgi:hypothetical protein